MSRACAASTTRSDGVVNGPPAAHGARTSPTREQAAAGGTSLPRPSLCRTPTADIARTRRSARTGISQLSTPHPSTLLA